MQEWGYTNNTYTNECEKTQTIQLLSVCVVLEQSFNLWDLSRAAKQVVICSYFVGGCSYDGSTDTKKNHQVGRCQ